MARAAKERTTAATAVESPREPLDEHPLSVRLSLNKNQLTGAEQRVSDYFAKHPHAAYMSITEVVEDSACSYGSIMRFCQKLGCSGFQEFKVLLALELGAQRREGKGDDFVEQAMQIAVRELNDTARLVDRSALEAAGRCIANATHVLIGAVGASTSVAASLRWKLNRIGVLAISQHDGIALAAQAVHLTPADVFVAVSASGASKDVLRSAQLAAEQGAKVVAVTNFPKSPLVKHSTHVICSATERDPIVAEAPPTVAREFVTHLLFEQVRRVKAVSDQSLADHYTLSDRVL